MLVYIEEKEVVDFEVEVFLLVVEQFYSPQNPSVDHHQTKNPQS